MENYQEIAEQEQIIRVVTPSGNGAHVFIPKEWTGEEVFIVRRIRQKADIKTRILDALDNYLEHIEGIYLYGSYARGEADANSDIDVLLITNKKLNIKIKGFEIIALLQDEIDEVIKIAPVMVYSALAEAKPILNAALLDKLKQKYRPKANDFIDYIKETESIIKINEDLLDPYSVILRLRGIFIINNLLKGKAYSKKWFLSWLKSKAGRTNVDKIYNDYLNRKRDNKIKERSKDNDIKPLLSLLKSETVLLKEKIHGKKRKKT
jgi:predicted nucleotidyltransferase